MRLTEKVDIAAASVLAFGCVPQKGQAIPVKKRKINKKAKQAILADKHCKVALRLQAPLTRTLAELLGVEPLLF
jgi:hypothetical protein